MGGEHPLESMVKNVYTGSSPRGRGTRLYRELLQQLVRIIPAWAGNTYWTIRTHGKKSDHPRVGGEHKACRSGPK